MDSQDYLVPRKFINFPPPDSVVSIRSDQLFDNNDNDLAENIQARLTLDDVFVFAKKDSGHGTSATSACSIYVKDEHSNAHNGICEIPPSEYEDLGYPSDLIAMQMTPTPARFLGHTFDDETAARYRNSDSVRASDELYFVRGCRNLYFVTYSGTTYNMPTITRMNGVIIFFETIDHMIAYNHNPDADADADDNVNADADADDNVNADDNADANVNSDADANVNADADANSSNESDPNIPETELASPAVQQTNAESSTAPTTNSIVGMYVKWQYELHPLTIATLRDMGINDLPINDSHDDTPIIIDRDTYINIVEQCIDKTPPLKEFAEKFSPSKCWVRFTIISPKYYIYYAISYHYKVEELSYMYVRAKYAVCDCNRCKDFRYVRDQNVILAAHERLILARVNDEIIVPGANDDEIIVPAADNDAADSETSVETVNVIILVSVVNMFMALEQ
jgi:hypothetical protein